MTDEQVLAFYGDRFPNMHTFTVRDRRRRVVGHDRSRVAFLAATTGTIRDPLVTRPLPFAEEAHAQYAAAL